VIDKTYASTGASTDKSPTLEEMLQTTKKMSDEKDEIDMQLVRAVLKAGVRVVPSDKVGLPSWFLSIPPKLYMKMREEISTTDVRKGD